VTPVPAVDATLQSLAAEAQKHLEAASAAQREGDWARYGEELKRLEAVILRMQQTP
jgi:uncharacterized membrane protein (UPF0182 family)